MDNRHIYRMVEETRQQCRFALAAFQSLKLRLTEADHEKVFVEAYAFLGHAVMVSRLLWPERASSAERGRQLRAELRIADASPLRLGAGRAQIERFDEAYEDWLTTAVPEANYVDMNLMPTGTMSGSREDVFQRSLDPDTLVFQLRGAPIPLRQINDASRALESAAHQWLRSHNPW